MQEYQYVQWLEGAVTAMIRWVGAASHNKERPWRLLVRAFSTLIAVIGCTFAHAQSPENSDWGYYGGNISGQRYSRLDQINRTNIDKLQVAWTYRTGELGVGLARVNKLAFEATPVLAFGLLYISTPTNIVIAIDPARGRERWRFDPNIDRSAHFSEVTSRGVTVWQEPTPAKRGICTRRVFMGTLDARLISLDANTGRPCSDFGAFGAVDLTRGLRIRDRYNYQVTSPPAVYRDLVIVGSSVGDNRATDVERGVIRAFDARTGELRWSFDPIPNSPTHPAAKEWNAKEAASTGAANAWAVMSVDTVRGLVYVPTGSASPDYFGGRRSGSNRFANSLLALEAATGKLVWHQQLVHHDLWDFDLAAQPSLVELDVEGSPVYAVLQATKSGLLFAFDRENGNPVFQITERRVAKSTVPGEKASPTQPFPATPPLVSQTPLTKDDAWGITIWDRWKCRSMIGRLRNEGSYTPPDLRGTLLRPGYIGGVGWGGVAFDPQRQTAIAAVNHLPMVVTLIAPALVKRDAASGDFPRSEFAYQTGTPFAVRREPLISPWGLPCTAPPWGTLVSVDLRRNQIMWQVPLGSTEGYGPWFAPTRTFGMPNMGGPIATAGGLVFVGAAADSYIRAFDVETGRELWKHRLPAGGQATPMTYRAGRNQRQYVVIAAGGHGGLGTPRGDYVVAFALPENTPE